jgi:hypothetical protein
MNSVTSRSRTRPSPVTTLDPAQHLRAQPLERGGFSRSRTSDGPQVGVERVEDPGRQGGHLGLMRGLHLELAREAQVARGGVGRAARS